MDRSPTSVSRPPLPPPSAATAASNPITRPTFTPPFQTKKPIPSANSPVLPPPSITASPPPAPPNTPLNPLNSSSPLPLPPPTPGEKMIKPLLHINQESFSSSTPSSYPLTCSEPSPSLTTEKSFGESDDEPPAITPSPSSPPPPPSNFPTPSEKIVTRSRSPCVTSSPTPTPMPSSTSQPSRSPPPFRSSNSFCVPGGLGKGIIPKPSASAPSKKAPELPPSLSPPPHSYSKTPPPPSSKPVPTLTRGTSFSASQSMEFQNPKKEKKKLAINIRPRSMLGGEPIGSLMGMMEEGEGGEAGEREDISPPVLAREEADKEAKIPEGKKLKRSISLTNATKGMAGVKKLGTKEVSEKLKENQQSKESKESKQSENKEKRKSFWGGKKKDLKESTGSAIGGAGAGLVGLNGPKKGASIPEVEIICDKLIEYFDEKMKSSEGLFRISGPAEKVAQLRDDVLAGKYENIMNPEENNEHTCASVMKVIYREAEELIVPNEEYEKLLSWHDSQTSLPDEEAFSDLSGLKAILDTLDVTRLRILKKMTRFLAQVATFSDLNMMTPANLGIVFSPNVIQTPPDADVFRQFEDASKTKYLMQLLIENTEYLFV